jgi:hypothetical protein
MRNPTPCSTRDDLLCPSSHPGIPGARVLGVVQHSEDGPDVLYLKELLRVTEAVLGMAAPLQPTEVFRMVAKCQTAKCPHFDGADCSLAARMVQILPAAVAELPHCQVRAECRWFHQEGAAACHRCPQIATVNYQPSETIKRVVALPPILQS